MKRASTRRFRSVSKKQSVFMVKKKSGERKRIPVEELIEKERKEGVERRILSIPLKDILQLNNSRQTYKAEETAELMTSMRHRGQLSPAGVRRTNVDGKKWEMVFGNRRFVAAEKLGWKSLDCVEVEAETDEEMLIINAVENMQRKDVPFAEQGRIFEGLIQQGLTTKEIAARIGVSHAMISRVMNTYRDIPKELRPRVVKGQAGLQYKGGNIPASTAGAVTAISSRAGLNVSQRKKLYEVAAKDGVTGLHVRKVGALLSRGIPMGRAVKEAADLKLITITVGIPFDQVKRLEKSHGCSIARILRDELMAIRKLGIYNNEK